MDKSMGELKNRVTQFPETSTAEFKSDFSTSLGLSAGYAASVHKDCSGGGGVRAEASSFEHGSVRSTPSVRAWNEVSLS